jgi:hypothetical protein
MIGKSTAALKMCEFHDFMGELRSLDDDLFKDSLGFYMTKQRDSAEYLIQEIARVEEATRSRLSGRAAARSYHL